MNGFEVFQLYRALKLHFTTKYDFNAYSGKMGNNAQYLKSGKVFFDKIAKKYHNDDDIKMLFVSNMLINPNKFIKEISDSEGHAIFNAWRKRNKTLTERFKNDLTFIKRTCDNSQMKYNDVFVSPEREHPLIIQMVTYDDIDLETFCILDNLMGFGRFLNRDLGDDLIWESLKNQIENYTCFINFDRVKLNNIAKTIFK